MAQTPEGRVKSWLYGSKPKSGPLYTLFPGVFVYKPHGGMFGQSGTADCFCLWRGVFFAIEIKREGKDGTPLQLKRLRTIVEAGGVGAILAGRDLPKLLAIKAAVMVKVVRYGT